MDEITTLQPAGIRPWVHKLLGVDVADGMCKELVDVQKYDNNLYPDQDEGFHDHAVTILLVAWGQFIDHDITLTAETKDIRHVKSMLSFLSYHDWQPFNSKVKW